MSLIDRQMDRLLPRQLETLLSPQSGPCVSMYLPTHRVWNETPQDPIRLKNLVREAEKALVDEGMRPTEARTLLERVRDLYENDEFWQSQSDGLALFVAEEHFLTLRLPLEFEELVIVNDRFHIKPLLRLLSGNGRFHALSLNLDQVRLWTGSKYDIREVALEDVPTSLDESLKYTEFQTQKQFHSGAARSEPRGERTGVYHGQGAGADDANTKKYIVEFFRQIDNGVRKALAEVQEPLVLIGPDQLQGLYRTVNHFGHLIEEGVTVNPEDLGADALHLRVWELIGPRYQRAHRDAGTNYERLRRKAPDRVSNELKRIVQAAYFKRVKVLFVEEGTRAWGRFDPDAQEVHISRTAGTGDQDLLDLAAAHTLRNGGTVYVEPPERMPDGSRAAAIFRY